MGRNVFQSSDPVAMLKALAAVVHDSRTGALGLRDVPRSGRQGPQPERPTSLPSEKGKSDAKPLGRHPG